MLVELLERCRTKVIDGILEFEKQEKKKEGLKKARKQSGLAGQLDVEVKEYKEKKEKEEKEKASKETDKNK